MANKLVNTSRDEVYIDGEIMPKHGLDVDRLSFTIPGVTESDCYTIMQDNKGVAEMLDFVSKVHEKVVFENILNSNENELDSNYTKEIEGGKVRRWRPPKVRVSAILNATSSSQGPAMNAKQSNVRKRYGVRNNAPSYTSHMVSSWALAVRMVELEEEVGLEEVAGVAQLCHNRIQLAQLQMKEI
ncbi:conserved hypothetical protein [Ricinus communis]|uniref:Uncharacterized protein n=1 Tax=Ricinus communis TaxID=3988 RepID=B9SLP6_RICCO|nr:conserved hypothetical protein [Ricinus communis]